MDCVSWFNFLSHTCDFGWGFLLFGCFRHFFNLICLFLFINFGLKLFHFAFHFKNLISFFYNSTGKSGGHKKNGSFLLERVKNLEMKLKSITAESNKGFIDESDELCDGDICNVDEVFDVILLRKMVKLERRRADAAYTELDKERVASATSTDETMSMILRLQNEKSLIKMEANHYRRLVEEKQIHDQEVIQSLRWIVTKHELERSYLEDQLRIYKQRLKIFKGEDMSEENDEHVRFFNSRVGKGSPCDGLISSLDFDSPPS